MSKSGKIEAQIAALQEALRESREQERARRLRRVRAAAARAGMGSVDIDREVLDREFRRIVEATVGAAGEESDDDASRDDKSEDAADDRDDLEPGYGVAA